MSESLAQSLTLLISHERSGSHLFAELLHSLNDVHVFDEACNPRAVDPKTNPVSFHGFRKAWGDANPDFWLNPSYQTQSAMVLGFFHHLKSLAGQKNAVVDIKYGHIHNFEGFWWPVFRRPLLFYLCQANRVSIIHLHRLNLMEAVVSAHLAEARKLWHSSDPNADELIKRSHRVKPGAVIQDIELLMAQASWIGQRWLPGARVLDVTYEELAEVVQNKNDLRQRVADFLGVTQKPEFSPKLKKIVTSLQQSVENFAELREACEKSGHERFFAV
jgi:hypothetical protein